MAKMTPKILIGVLQGLLKGAVLAKGGTLEIPADLVQKGERSFHLKIEDHDDRFLLTLRDTLPDEEGSVSLPDESSRLWTPGS